MIIRKGESVAVKTIGQVLKEKRTELGLGLAEVEKISKVQKIYIVALETDDYKAMPSSFYVRAYLKQYAEKLGLNSDILLAAFESQSGISVEEEEELQDTYQFIKPAERFEADENEEKEMPSWKYYLPIISLSATAIAIVAIVALAVVFNHQAPSITGNANDYSLSTSSTESRSSVSSSTSASTKAPESDQISVSGTGNALTVMLAQPSQPVKLVFTAAATSDIIFSLTNSNLTSSQEINATRPSLEASLNAAATSSVITVNSVVGLSLTINGKKVDLSSMTGAGTISLQLATATNSTTTSS